MKYLKICLIIAIGGAFLFYYYTYNPSVQTGNFISCPSNKFLGLFCPGCGSQRMLHNLLHLNLLEAFRYNPLLFLLFPFVIYISAIQVSNLFFGTTYRVKILYKNWFVFALFGTIFLYGILRNLPWYPFYLLAPPN